ncbi:hypothetical protein FS317_25650, partial [Microvirga sp. M8]|nr:hypothetical protein [Microvirga tunisiensis]
EAGSNAGDEIVQLIGPAVGLACVCHGATPPCLRQRTSPGCSINCLVAERCWNRVRYAIEEYTWRFDGLRRRASHRRRT